LPVLKDPVIYHAPQRLGSLTCALGSRWLSLLFANAAFKLDNGKFEHIRVCATDPCANRVWTQRINGFNGNVDRSDPLGFGSHRNEYDTRFTIVKRS
jgi:hypothetical protein